MTLTNLLEKPLSTDFDDEEYNIPRSSLLRILHGTAVATEVLEQNTKPVISFISSYQGPCGSLESDQSYQQYSAPTDTFSFYEWLIAIESNFSIENDEESRRLASLALAIAFLRQWSRSQAPGANVVIELSEIWDLIQAALTNPRLSYSNCRVLRSSQGFLAVPLCSLFKDGEIDEQFRLHVWLPDGRNGNTDFMLHAHQTSTRNWILAGEGSNHYYEVMSMEGHQSNESTVPTKFTMWEENGKNYEGSNCDPSQTYSATNRSGRIVLVSQATSALYTRDMVYSIPAAGYHRTEVSPDILYATLVFFDSHMGFEKDAYALVPMDAESPTNHTDFPPVRTMSLMAAVGHVRFWERLMSQGRRHSQRAEWEHALQAFNSALDLCEPDNVNMNMTHYKRLVLGELGNTNRRFGRYEQAKDQLEEALADTKSSLQSLELSVELGVVYRHMNRLADATRVLQNQYDIAKKLGFERARCRAIGNLGMINFQLFRQSGDYALLDLAMEQLLERVESSRCIKETIDDRKVNPKTKLQWLQDAKIWESIGLSRLSLCYSASGKTKEAIIAARDSFNIVSTSEDTTLVAATHFFYGRALLLDGQHSLALQYFNSPPAACTPAIALSKEPSDEHRQYLQELVAAGADFDLVDEQGYTALDYAVFNDDSSAQGIVLEGLRRTLDADVEAKLAARLVEARIRKGYREIFQEKLRPVLLRLERGAANKRLQELRRVYAEALVAHQELRSIFDELKSVRYSDFLRFDRLPRSSDGLTAKFLSTTSSTRKQESAAGAVDFVIFISYRWINKDNGVSSPDDKWNTQYGRIVEAVEEFMRTRPYVRREGVGLWLDHACINQDNPNPGVTALPLLLAQCDVVISLVDETYYSRAWCSVEALMVQTLRWWYGVHSWLVQVEQTEHEDGMAEGQVAAKKKWILLDGPLDLRINIAEKQLTFEDDRPKVLFLERQTKLLGWGLT